MVYIISILKIHYKLFWFFSPINYKNDNKMQNDIINIFIIIILEFQEISINNLIFMMQDCN